MKNLMLLLLAICGLLLSGCQQFEEAWAEATNPEASTWGKKYEPRYIISINQEVKYPRGSNLEASVSTFTGENLWINVNQFFSTKNIREIKALPRTDRPGTYDIALRLDNRGCTMWTLLATNFRHEKLVLMVDNFFQCRFTPQPLASPTAEWVVIEHPFDEVTAKGLEQFSIENYEHFTPDPTRLW